MKREIHQPRPPETNRSLIATLLFMVGFVAVLVVVCWLYLFPAIRAASSAIAHDDHKQTRELAATAWLMLVVVLFVLFAGLLLAFRVGRFFFPRPQPPRRKPTQYVDAWEESGRRVNAADLPDDEVEEGGNAE